MLQVRLLGQFDLVADGKRVVIPARSGQSLFAYLVLHPGSIHRRETLAGLIWPDSPEEIARRNLRQQLWLIRKALATTQSPAADSIQANEISIGFTPPSDFWLDVAILERPVSGEDDVNELGNKLALYRGELLPGFYDDWVMLERDRIQSVFEARMQVFLQRLVADERWAAVMEWGEKWLSFGGTPEPAYRALLLAYAAHGDMANVSATYQRCVKALHDELGVEPSVETRALYEGLVQGSLMHHRVAIVQPSGTVTFLFTDIEGSTQLLDRLGAEYATVLDEHHRLLREAVTHWNGREVDTQGDAFFVTFTRASDAVQCAAEVQRAFAAHAWPQDAIVRVRMGLHTGEPLMGSMGYVGMDVHRAARIGDAGHGGQVLLSHTTRELVLHDLPSGVTIRDLGEHRLKDMKYPTPIYQLAIDGLPVDFPPLKTKFTGTEAPTPGEPPFKGLQYFEEQDADLFYGREVLTAKLVNRLRGEQRLTVVVGASGSGKSSLVRAGLIPALKSGLPLADGTEPLAGSTDWRFHVLTPTMRPLQAIATELTRDDDSMTSTARLIDDLSEDPRSLALFLARRHPQQRVLMVVDQFEELYTLCRDDLERQAFVDNLLYAITPSLQHALTLVLTLRADFYAHLAQYSELRDAAARQQEYIGPMTAEELRRAIEEPAKRGHWEFEPGLVDLILRDLGDEPGGLPLLSHALLETWKRRAGPRLTLAGYADAGGVRGAIAHTAQGVYDQLAPGEQAIARNVFLRLTELGEGTEDTRRRASFEELISSPREAENTRAVLNTLANARLITLSKDTAEVAHEALIREWPALREWLNENREGLRLHRQLTEATHEWELMERDASMVYRGVRLTQAREFAASHPDALNEQEVAFLSASTIQEKSEEQERQEQQERELQAAQQLAEEQKQRADLEMRRAEEQAHASKSLRRRAYFLVGALLLALGLAAFALFLGNQANQNAITATSRELAAAAISNLEIDPERSILLGIQALATQHTVEAENALHRAILASRVKLVMHHDAQVWAVSYSPDGSRIASGSEDHTAKIWDANTGKLLMTLDQTGAVDGIAFSPDGTRIATALDDNTAIVWDATAGKEILKLSGHTAPLINIAFSTDGKRIVTSSVDKTAKVWDANTGQELLTFSGHKSTVFDVAFSPDGTHIASSGQDGLVRIWDSKTGKESLSLSAEAATQLNSLTFSPDGKRLAIANDGIYPVMIWDVATGMVLLRGNLGHTVPPRTIAFSPDGKLAVTAGYDQKAKVWDSTTGQVLYTLSGHTQAINSVMFNPDGTRVVTASSDGTVRIWDITPSKELLYIPFTHPENNWSEWLSYSPDGKRLLTDYTDSNARVWDSASGKKLMQLSGLPNGAIQPAYSSDGKWIAAGSDNGTIIIWDAHTGKQKQTLVGANGLIRHTSFSPDGTHLASASDDDGTIMIWDLTTGKASLVLHGYAKGVSSVAYAPDGKHIITGDKAPNGIIWDTTTGEKLFILPHGSEAWVVAVAYSPDGKRVATADLTGISKVWDTSTGKELFTLKGQNSWVNAITFSPDEKLIATAAKDGTARVWDATTGDNVLTLAVDSDGAGGVSFSPDGKRLAVGAFSGIYIFALPIDDVLVLASSRVTRSLTVEECQQYMHKATCPPSR